MSALYPGQDPTPLPPTPAPVVRRAPGWFERLSTLAERAEQSVFMRMLRPLVGVLVLGVLYVVVTLALTAPFAFAWLLALLLK